jgi:hypothetical protein
MSKKKKNKKNKKTYNNPHYSTFKKTSSQDIKNIANQVFGSLYFTASSD